MSFKVPKLPKGLLKQMTHVQRAGGTWQGGVYQEGTETTVTFMGHITPLTDDDLKYDPNGTYTTDDEKLYCEVEFDNNTTITYNGRSYTIQGKLDYQQLGTFRRYIIRRVGAIGEPQ